MRLTIISKPDCPYCKALFSLMDRYQLRETVQLELLQDDSEQAQAYDYYYLPAVFLDGRRIIHGKVEQQQLYTLLTQVLQNKKV